jgi:hypothetical protein
LFCGIEMVDSSSAVADVVDGEHVNAAAATA